MTTDGLARTALLASALALPTAAHAQFPNYPEPNLPSMGACVNSTPQQLPAKWQATTLMAPYLYTGKPTDYANLSSRAQLQVGRFVYDGDAHLMRATRYGAKLGGIMDLLVADKATYVLTGSYDNPRCVARLPVAYKVPSRTWQDPGYQPVCVGNHATAPTISTGPKVDWWKQKSPVQEPGAQGEAADWFWFDQNGYPTRTMFWYKHDGLPAILGDYAFSNFQEFKPGNAIDLKKILATCESATLPVWQEEDLVKQAIKTETKQANPASTLIPGLSYQACTSLNANPPTWPVEIYMTSFSTAAKYGTPRPLVTSVYYKPGTPEIRTRLHKIEKTGPTWSDALLIDRSSYGVDTSETPPYKQIDCGSGPHTSLPGSPHRNWGVRGHCQCMGVIQNNPVLSPGRNTEIIGCPLPLIATKPGQQNGNTMFWMWYTITDPMQPVVFLQSKPDVTIGTGLSLADYAHWQPKPVPSDIYTTPAAGTCPAPPASAPTPPGACMGCHNVSTNK
jgi:hypothetical protein